MKSVLYDGWRHLYFIYPAFLLTALMGLKYLWEKPWNVLSPLRKILRVGIISFVILNLISTLSFMIANHPFQNVYFNILAGRNGESIREKFDLDYWGLSYRQGLEYIARSDLRQEIKVFFLPWVGMNNLHILPLADRKRIVQTENKNEADYLIGNFRLPDWRREYPPEDEEVYSIQVSGIKILAVYRLKQ